MSNGKGDKRRRCQISRDEYEKNWDEVFKPKKEYEYFSDDTVVEKPQKEEEIDDKH